MWLRSQDKKTLVNADCVMVVDNYITVNTLAIRVALGEYETQERALEVLDQIQQRLTEGHRSDVIVGATRVYRENVFEMPEE